MAASHIALKGSDRAARSKRVSSHTLLDYVIAAEQPSRWLTRVPIIGGAWKGKVQALVNLIDNAMKYSGESKEILVRLGQAGEFVNVAVINRGIGIPREDQQRIFEKFYRNSSSLVHDVRGSGLGLTIVRDIVDAHGGPITVESEPGKGCQAEQS
jgi:signal transduction histidine kinase